mgnify:FL=1
MEKIKTLSKVALGLMAVSLLAMCASEPRKMRRVDVPAIMSPPVPELTR